VAFRRPPQDSPEAMAATVMDPLVLPSPQWADTLPDWMPAAVVEARARSLEKPTFSVGGVWEPDLATEEEVMAYLYCLSLEMPLRSEWTRVYLYVAGRVIGRQYQEAKLPDDIRVDSLGPDEARLLDDLRRKIWHTREKRRPKKGRNI